jgi:hypothetical protein
MNADRLAGFVTSSLPPAGCTPDYSRRDLGEIYPLKAGFGEPPKAKF